VPTTHWAYGAVNELVKAGIIDGYNDGTYRGDKAITRYEFAIMITKSLENYDKADTANKALIDKLSAEFANELNTLGTRVTKLENKIGKFTFNGDFRVRYEWTPDGATITSWPGGVGSRTAKVMTKERYRLFINDEIDKNVKVTSALVYTGGTTGYSSTSITDGGSSFNPNASVSLDAMFLTYNAPDGSVYKFGRNFLFLGQGLLWDVAHSSGLQMTFGNKLRTMVGTQSFISKTWYFTDMKYDVNNKIRLTAAHIEDKNKDWYNSTSLGFIYKLTPDLVLSTEVGINDNAKINVNNGRPGNIKAGSIKLKYGEAKRDQIGTNGLWIMDKKAQKGFDTQYSSTWNMITPYPGGLADNLKGFEYGFEYTLFKNGIFQLIYDPLKSYDGSQSKKFLRSELLVRF